MREQILFGDVADFLSCQNRVFVAENYGLTNDELSEKLGIGNSSISQHRRDLRRHELGKVDTSNGSKPNKLGNEVIKCYNELLESLKSSDVKTPFRESLTSGKTRKYFVKIPENRTHAEIYKSFYMDGNDGTWAFNKLEDAGFAESSYEEEISPTDQVLLTEEGEEVYGFYEDIERMIANYVPDEDLLLPSD